MELLKCAQCGDRPGLLERAEEVPGMKIRPNDIVFHKPSGEEWVVCGVNYDTGELIPCGYPFPSIARIDDCVLVKSCNKPQTEEMKKSVKRACNVELYRGTNRGGGVDGYMCSMWWLCC